MLLRSFVRAVCSMALIACTSAWSAEGASADRKKQLDDDLARIRAELTSAQQQIAEKSKSLWQQQHDLEYGDPEMAKLREEIVAIEKQLVDKRQQLNTRLSLKPEMKEIEKQRRALFQNIEKLRQEEQAVMNELRALEFAGELPK
jgi:chromosome segregation ATPase